MQPSIKPLEKECCKKRLARLDCLPKNHNLRQGRRVGWVYRCLTNSLFGGKEVPTGTCPECDADVHVDTDTDKGESVSCEECGTELEVVGLDPVELDIVEEEDLDDDEDEDEF
jgi:alpha-aminoadipate carrier protein LysW